MVVVDRKQYIAYLVKEGYKEWTDNGDPSTAQQYAYAVEKVMRNEHIERYSELDKHIFRLVCEYGEYGEKSELGEEGNNTVRSALRRFLEFLMNEHNFNPFKQNDHNKPVTNSDNSSQVDDNDENIIINALVEYMCSPEGCERVKKLLKTKVPDKVLDRIEISIKDKEKTIYTEPVIVPKTSRVETIQDTQDRMELVNIVKDPHLRIKETEKVQDWVKRILTEFYYNNKLDTEELNKLHDLHYCERTFGIGYPLLCDNKKDTFYKEISRYWQTWKLGKYYVCSQWWKGQELLYIAKIGKWINKVN